jgi:steroid delta-isomerase-like uncharacterized protein
MSSQRSEEVMRSYLTEVVGKRRYELIPQLAAEDMIDHTQALKGRQGLVNHVQNFHRTFPDVTIQINRIVAGENDAVGWWSLKGTHSQELFGQPGSGKALEFDVVSFFRLKDGLLAEYHVVADALTAVLQMGRKLT